MYSIELGQLDKKNVLSKVQGTIEDFAEEYGLHNHFGTISFAMTALMTKLFENSSDYQRADVVFNIDNDGVSVDIHAEQECKALADALDHEESTDLFAIRKLTDQLEYSADGRDFSITFDVKPVFNSQNHTAAAYEKKRQNVQIF